MGELTRTKTIKRVIRDQENFNTFFVMYKEEFFEDGEFIFEKGVVESLHPDTDIQEIEDSDVKMAAEYYWTEENKQAYKDSKKIK